MPPYGQVTIGRVNERFYIITSDVHQVVQHFSILKQFILARFH
jgi:hypothetical protein